MKSYSFILIWNVVNFFPYWTQTLLVEVEVNLDEKKNYLEYKIINLKL